MLPAAFLPGAPGKVLKTRLHYCAFVPHPLPPHLDLSPTAGLLEEAGLALGSLRGAGARLPNPHILIRPFVRREAVLSSRIEGTQTSFSDLLFFEAASNETPRAPDVPEVVNYVRAVEHGIARLHELPLSLRLCREIHETIMTGHPHATPGAFRTSQNWIGPPGCTLNEATYVPPPPDEMSTCLRDWEKFLHARDTLPVLVQAALIHYQFEAIHPFVDGNGRVGRLLVALFLAERKIMPQPLLYLSAFFEKYRDDYYRLLLDVSTKGHWNNWIQFFLRGVRTQAEEALLRVDKLLTLQERYTKLSLAQGRAGASLAKLVGELFLSPATTVRQAERLLDVTFAAAQKNVNRLVNLGILREVTGKERHRIYLAEEIFRAAFEEIIPAKSP
ncbi:MAG: Fic family protein [Polyangiales bacterium]